MTTYLAISVNDPKHIVSFEAGLSKSFQCRLSDVRLFASQSERTNATVSLDRFSL